MAELEIWYEARYEIWDGTELPIRTVVIKRYDVEKIYDFRRGEASNDELALNELRCSVRQFNGIFRVTRVTERLDK